MTTILETERLILRPLRRSDLGALASALNNFNITRNTTRIPHPYTISDAEDFLAIEEQIEPGTLRLSITQKAGGDIVCGGIGYERIEDGAELGYWLAEPQWGKGYGREAAHAITRHAFEAAAHSRLAAGYRLGNEASRRILERLGFRPTGIEPVFSQGAGAEIDVMRMELRREARLNQNTMAT